MKSTICVAEDRAACEPALKILLLSLSTHCPGVEVNLFYPRASYDFHRWMKKCPQVVLQKASLKSNFGWNIKPQALMCLLDHGFDEVIWIDSDILVTRNIADVFSGLDRETIAATEDPPGAGDDPDALRARLWGFSVGRVLPFGLNTCVVRVTKAHQSLLKRWWELVQLDVYQDCQKLTEWKKRPVHMAGDQDVLTALLTSREFSDIPVHILRRGKHILQFGGMWGYTTAQRIAKLLGTQPTFIHQYGSKPWSEYCWPSEQTMRNYVQKIYVDVSPYTLLAKRYRNELECDTEWMDPHYKLSGVLRVLGMGHSALAGLPMAIVLDFGRLTRSCTRLAKRAL